MDRNVKAFILAALIYLVLGGFIGVLMSFNIGQPVLFRYAHLHLLLLGFMSMMVYGVGYFILPRFNGTTMYWPWMITPQFWVANLGLLGLAFAAIQFRGIFALISLVSMIMFALNMIVSLVAAPSVQERLAKVDAGLKSPPPAPADLPKVLPQVDSPKLNGEMIIGDVLRDFPELEDVVRTFFGDGCFTCPGQSTETLTQAAAVHNIDPELLLSEMRKKLQA
jgi:hypothetical protein